MAESLAELAEGSPSPVQVDTSYDWMISNHGFTSQGGELELITARVK